MYMDHYHNSLVPPKWNAIHEYGISLIPRPHTFLTPRGLGMRLVWDVNMCQKYVWKGSTQGIRVIVRGLGLKEVTNLSLHVPLHQLALSSLQEAQ